MLTLKSSVHEIERYGTHLGAIGLPGGQVRMDGKVVDRDVWNNPLGLSFHASRVSALLMGHVE